MYLHCNFHSDILGKACGMNIILPQKVNTQIGMTSSGGRTTYPMLFLLHGLSDDYTIWMRRTSIERYAAQYNLIIVMPDGGRSFSSLVCDTPRPCKISFAITIEAHTSGFSPRSCRSSSFFEFMKISVYLCFVCEYGRKPMFFVRFSNFIR